MSIRLMHLADLHLGASLTHLGDKAAQRSRDMENAFVRALESVPERNVDAVVIAGDLFDSSDPAAELVARVKAALHQTAQGGVPIILVPGTHDSHRYSRCVYRRTEFAGVNIIFEPGSRIQKTINGETVYFYGYSGGRKKPLESTVFRRGEEPGIHIALVHGSVQEGTHWATSTRDFSVLPKELEESGFDYIALGHHHNFREFKYSESLAVYPGTLEGVKFGEDGDRCLTIAEIDENGVTLERIKHNRRRMAQIEINLAHAGIESADELAEAISAHADTACLMRVVLTGTAHFIPAREAMEARLSGQFFYLEITDKASLVESGLIRSLRNEDTVRGIFARAMLEKIEQSSDEDREIAELALRLGIEQFLQLDDADN